MAQSKIDFQAWDGEMAGKTADYEKLYQQMLQASKEPSTESVEIWWRLAFVTYQITLNYVDFDAIKAKTHEALQHADKALALDGKHFQANVWMATVAGKLALLESVIQEKCK